jgi:hypothetical protein
MRYGDARHAICSAVPRAELCCLPVRTGNLRKLFPASAEFLCDDIFGVTSAAHMKMIGRDLISRGGCDRE